MEPRIKVSLEQGTPEWLEWRKKGIGSSEVCAILGLSKYSNPQKLWKEKTTGIAEERDNDYILEKGHEVEAYVRAKFELKSTGDFPPALFEYGYLRASLDGYNNSINTALEIKFVGYEAFDEPIIPSHYAQVQTALFVSGAVKMIFIRARKSEEPGVKYDTKEEVIEFDTKYWTSVEKMIESFQKCVINGVMPVDENEINDAELKKLCKKWISKDAKFKKAKEEIEALVEEIKGFKKTGTCVGVRISKSPRIGSVQYETIPALAGVDLDKYRGPSSFTWKVEQIKVKGKKK